ncbi:MAG: type II secretion system protein [Dehalococcoidia bacterium]|nr:type II secretion system protein [Dehalococcoidia bacterium]
MRFWQKIMGLNRRELGITFLETVIALAILGAVSVAFLNGLTSASKSVFIVDEKTTAGSLAQSQMEWIKNASYSYNATSYSAAPIPDGKDYLQYSSVVSAEPVHTPDDGIQKITVSIQRSGKGVYFLQGYKVDR